MTKYIEIHILQDVPPNNLNRDETGSPKTALYGGVTRHRVSSQAWKKAVRNYFTANFADNDYIGLRTLNLPSLLAAEYRTQNPEMSEEEANSKARDVLVTLKLLKVKTTKKSGTEVIEQEPDTLGALFFASRAQVKQLVQEDLEFEKVKHELDNLPEWDVDRKTLLTKQLKDKLNAVKNALSSHNSLDLALFGRMVADSKDMNVDASSQVAHSISTHAVSTEFDYFTAVDDFNSNDHAGAAMIGDIEFTSSTLYRYANINVDALKTNYAAAPETLTPALTAYIKAVALSMPTGKQNTFAATTPPAAVVLIVRESQPFSLAGAFEKPVPAGDAGYLEGSVKALTEYLQGLTKAYGLTPESSYGVALSPTNQATLQEVTETATLDEAITKTVATAIS